MTRDRISGKMRWTLSLFLFCFKLARSDVKSDKSSRAECVMWSYLENKTMPLQDQGHATCITNDECTGFTCEGMFKEKPVTFGMKVHNCQEPPGLELFGHAPQFNAYNFTHVFKHGSKYEVPGAMLNSQSINMTQTIPGFPSLPGAIPGLNIYFVVSMEPNPENHTLKIGLQINACMNTSVMDPAALKLMNHSSDEMCILKKPIFNNTEIPVPHCEKTYPAKALVGEICNINEIGQCGDYQTCTQESAGSEMGRCECLSSYIKKSDRTCIHKDDALIPPKPRDSPSPQPHIAETETGSGAVAAGVISILIVIALLGVAVATVHRLRLVPRLRARLTNTPYEDIVIADRHGLGQSQQNIMA